LRDVKSNQHGTLLNHLITLLDRKQLGDFHKELDLVEKAARSAL
jgi:hypothetical protein